MRLQAFMAPVSFEARILAPAERLLDALSDPIGRVRTGGALLLAFMLLWTLYGLLAHGGTDVIPDVAQGVLWSRQPALEHHPPLMGWTYRIWFTVFPLADWASYLLAAVNTTVTLWIVW